MWGVWLLGATCFSFSAYAQNKVKAPMEDVNQVVDLTLDSLNKAKTARPVAGSTRKGDNPVLFLVGNSTMRTVPEEVSGDDFIDKFLAFIEENNWSFGGGYRTIIDGYYMNEDGTRGKHVLDA